MRILIVCQHYAPEPFAMTSIAETLVAFGHEVTVVTALPNYGYETIIPGYEKRYSETVNGVHIYRVSNVPRKGTTLSIIRNYLSFWSHSRRFVRHLKASFDIVYSMSLSPIISVSGANLYARKHHVPHVLHCVDLWPESAVITHHIRPHGLFYPLLLTWSRRIYRQADEILIGSPSYETYFDHVLHIRDKGFAFIPQPALVTEYDKPAMPLGPGFNLIYAGNLGSLQLLDVLIDAAKQLQPLKNFRIHVIGMGSCKEHFLGEISRNHLEDILIYHGALPAPVVSQYIRGADALYVALRSKGYVGATIPNKMIMYLALAKPIIGVVGGDAKALLEKAGGALLSEETGADLAEKIKMMSAMGQETKEKMGLQNRAYFEAHFRTETIVKEIEHHLSKRKNRDNR